METIVTLVRLVYHDVPSIGLELEVADAVLLDVSHHIGEHTLDEVGTDTSRIVFLAAQSLGYIHVVVAVLLLLLVGARSMMKMTGSLPIVAHRWLIQCASLNHAAEVSTDKSMKYGNQKKQDKNRERRKI